MGRPKNGKFIGCAFCTKEFYIIPAEERKGKKFCSIDCCSKFRIGKKTGPMSKEQRMLLSKIRLAKFNSVIRQCFYCKTDIHVQESRCKKYPRSFCSKRCFGASNKGKGYGPTECLGTNGYYVKGAKTIHRIAVEKFLNRSLTKDETIHHINEIKTDNRLENLYLFPTGSEHILYHWNVKKGKCAPITISNLL